MFVKLQRAKSFYYFDKLLHFKKIFYSELISGDLDIYNYKIYEIRENSSRLSLVNFVSFELIMYRLNGAGRAQSRIDCLMGLISLCVFVQLQQMFELI